MQRLTLCSLLMLWITTSQITAQSLQTDRHELAVEPIANGLVHPWSLAFISDQQLLITERPGRLLRLDLDQGRRYEISGLPAIAASGQGGLLDIALHPEFDSNQLIYLSFSDQTQEGMTTRVIRARLKEDQLEDLTDIFTALPRSSRGFHFGSRLVFDAQGYLYISVGDRGEMQRAQDLSDHAGTVVRLHDDGRIPSDNPFVGQAEARDEIYTYGHRNPQGMIYWPERDEIWINEHGPRGGDKINRLIAGSNYGWPLVTYGTHYDGRSITPHTQLPGIKPPLLDWTPSIAPSGLLRVTSTQFPHWQDQLLNGALAGQRLVRVSVTESDQGDLLLVEEERMLGSLGHRIRDVRQGPNGDLWLLTDAANGQLLRLRAAD